MFKIIELMLMLKIVFQVNIYASTVINRKRFNKHDRKCVRQLGKFYK